MAAADADAARIAYAAAKAAALECDCDAPQQLAALAALEELAHGCDCKNQGNTKPPETCKRAADAAVRLLLRMEADIGGGEDGDYCGGGGPLKGLLEPLPSEARDRIRIMSRMCFGGVGGPRDFALTAVVECLRRVVPA